MSRRNAEVSAIVYGTGGLVYRSHPSMGKAGKYGAGSNRQGQELELSRNVKELGLQVRLLHEASRTRT